MDHAPPHSPSPERSLTKKLLKGRRQKKGLFPTSTRSSISSTDGLHGEAAGGLRGSLHDSVEKLKDLTRPSHHHDNARRNSIDSSPKLHKLMPSLSMRKKDKTVAEVQEEEADVARGRSTVVRTETAGTSKSRLNIVSDGADATSPARSRSGGSSLLTEDSDVDESLVRPGLTTHPSHAGYLTFTSPLIAAQTLGPSDAVTPPPSTIESAVASNSINTPALHLNQASEDKFGGNNSLVDTESPAEPYQEVRAGGNNHTVGALGLGLTTQLDESSIPNSSQHPEFQTQPTLPRKVVSISLPNRILPSTVVTPPTPIIPAPGSPAKRAAAANLSLGPLPTSDSSDPRIARIPTSSGIAQRRVRSGTTSSRSGQQVFPLSPTVEEAKTPGGSLTHPSGSGGFFSSVFSTAQNAVSQLSNTFNTSSHGTGQRSRSATTDFENTGSAGGEEVIETNPNKSDVVDDLRREPAVATLGSGDLSLEHLGIIDTAVDSGGMASPADAGQFSTRSPRDSDASSRAEEAVAASNVVAASQPMTATQSEKMLNERNITPIVNDNTGMGRPRSIASTGIGSVPGDITPPRPGAEVDPGSIRRSGSVRSHISTKVKRHRRSSISASGAIAAALGSSHAALANPAGQANGPRSLGGFPLASSKRNKDFHQLFRSVPESDRLIEDWSAALQRDILLQGRFYVSEKHVCFSSNIMGWVTNLVISFDEVLSMEKKTTAMLFPNGIAIQTLHARNVFATFLSRDTTYDLLIALWKVGHNLRVSEHGHTLDESGTGDKLQPTASNQTEDDSDDDSDSYSDDDDEETVGSFVDAGASVAGSDVGDAPRANDRRSPSMNATVVGGSGPVLKQLDSSDGIPGVGGAQDFPGPPVHAPTECTDQDAHFDKQLIDTTIPAPLGKIYSMMFGPQSGQVMRKFLLEDQKSEDLQLEDDRRGMGEERRQSAYSFVKQLGGSIGPKQTKCLVTQTLDAFDLEKAVSVTCSTQTPDVPSGNSFVTKTKYCLMWGPSNSTRFLMSCTVEWSAKSWLKGPIEKGANDGQLQYGKDIVAFFKAQVASKSPQRGPVGKIKKGKKRRATNDDAVGTSNNGIASNKDGKDRPPTKANWGPLEPLHAVLEPVVDIIGSLASPTGILGVLLGVFVFLYIRASWYPSGRAIGSLDFGALDAPQRLAAYERMWRREESELWAWLEDRANLEAIVVGSDAGLDNDRRRERQQVLHMREFAGKLQEERMTEREVDEAIRVTSERLEALKAAVKAKKGQGGA